MEEISESLLQCSSLFLLNATATQSFVRAERGTAVDVFLSPVAVSNHKQDGRRFVDFVVFFIFSFFVETVIVRSLSLCC